MEDARRNNLLAGEAIHALAKGEDTEDAQVGALLVAEFFQLVRDTLTK